MKKSKNIMKTFESVSAMCQYLATGTIQPAFEGIVYSELGDKSFTRTENFKEAQHLLEVGDKEIAQRFSELGLANVQKFVKTEKRRELYTCVEGILPHVPNYIAGVPASMINVRQRKIAQPVVNVFYDMNALANVDEEDMLEASVNLTKAILLMEAKGTRVNLYTGALKESSGQQIGMAVRIKASSQHMDILKMCYPLCHPSFERRHFFRFEEVTVGVGDSFSYGYGHNVYESDKQALLALGGLRDVAIIDFYEARGLCPHDIVDIIQKKAGEQ